MLIDKHQLLESLKVELKCFDSGNYSNVEKQPWRARLAFEDSACCPNYDHTGRRVPCEKCVLMDMVPPDRRKEKIPCRFIPLNPQGETIDSLYRCGTQKELETALSAWLRKTIHRLEEEIRQERRAEVWSP